LRVPDAGTEPLRHAARLRGLGLALTVLLLISGLGAQPAAAEGQPDTAPQERVSLPQLEDEVMCPICGTLLGLSRAPAAERQRVFMRRLIREGKSEEEIKDALVAEYGPQVLALPDDEEVNFWVYVVPVAGLILAAGVALWAGLSWRRNRDRGSPGAPAPSGPTGAEAARLERELDEYDR
jgi:cytochrome c-type biogenesis protein CcmH